jgi:hypothetical protein
MLQGLLRTYGRVRPTNELDPGISQLWEADDGGILEKMGKKAKI